MRSDALLSATPSSCTRAPAAASDLRSSACAQTPPKVESDALMTAAGLPTISDLPAGRDAQSMAFLITPGTEWLYSGVEISRASASPIR